MEIFLGMLQMDVGSTCFAGDSYYTAQYCPYFPQRELILGGQFFPSSRSKFRGGTAIAQLEPREALGFQNCRGKTSKAHLGEANKRHGKRKTAMTSLHKVKEKPNAHPEDDSGTQNLGCQRPKDNRAESYHVV